MDIKEDDEEKEEEKGDVSAFPLLSSFQHIYILIEFVFNNF